MTMRPQTLWLMVGPWRIIGSELELGYGRETASPRRPILEALHMVTTIANSAVLHALGVEHLPELTAFHIPSNSSCPHTPGKARTSTKSRVIKSFYL